jgi:hypothetical protein
LGQVALEEEVDAQTGAVQIGDQASCNRKDDNVKDWLNRMKELSYHFLRFGSLSAPFHPDDKLPVLQDNVVRQYDF